MSAIRPAPRDTSFVQPDVAESSFVDYASSLVYDSLYHSPISGISRLTESYLERNDTDFNPAFPGLSMGGPKKSKISAEEATKLYGFDGELKFTEPVYESFAQLLLDRKIAERRREYEIYSGSRNGWGRKISGFGVSMVSTIIDPVNLASMFVPVVGEARYAQGVERSLTFLQRGLVSPKTVMRMVGGNRVGFRLTKGALEGAVGAAMVEPFNLLPALDEQAHYGWKDSALNIVFSSGMGAGIRGIGGYIHDNFLSVTRGMKQLDPQTHEAAVMGAISDIVQDKPVSSPADIVSADHNIVQAELAEVNSANMFKIAEEHLSRLETLKEQGTITPAQDVRRKLIGAMLRNPTEVTPENLAALFELKINDDVSRMPGAYKFMEGWKKQHEVTNREPIKFNEKDFEAKLAQISEYGDKFLEQFGSDDILPHEMLIDEKQIFKKIAKKLASMGYDILNKNVELRMGAESMVFLLKDKVVKVSPVTHHFDLPGVTIKPDLEGELGPFRYEISDRVTPLGESISPEMEYQIVQAFELLGKYYGFSTDDIGKHNLGFDSQGNLRIIDRGVGGTGYEMKEGVPSQLKNPKLAQFAGVKLDETGMLIYNQLVKQIEQAQAEIKSRTENKIQEILQRRSKPEVEPTAKSPDEAPIKQEPEPIERLSKEEEDETSKEVAALEDGINDIQTAEDISAELDPEVQQASQIADKLAKWADKTVKESRKRTNSVLGPDPELLVAYAVKGFTLLHNGLRDFAAWSKVMIQEFGNAIKPHLEELFKQVQSVKITPEMIGLEQRTGVLGKQGYFYSINPKIEASVQITPEGIHLTNIRAREEGKGAGSEFMTKLKQYADSNGLKITLTAAADDADGAIAHQETPLQIRLENFYQKHGFKPVDNLPLEDNYAGRTYVYEPGIKSKTEQLSKLSLDLGEAQLEFITDTPSLDDTVKGSYLDFSYHTGRVENPQGGLQLFLHDNGNLQIVHHELDAELRGKNIGGKAITEISKRFGLITSDATPSEDAIKMWKRIGGYEINDSNGIWGINAQLNPEFQNRLKESLTLALADQRIKQAKALEKAVNAGAACISKKMF